MKQHLISFWANTRVRCAAVWSHLSGLSIADILKSLVIPLIVSVLGTWGANEIQNSDSKRIKNSSAFIDESRTFDVVIANYVQKILNNKTPDPDATQQIVNNLLRQSNLVLAVQPYLNTKDRHLVNDYKKLLAQFYDVVPQSDSVLHMQAFWEDASKVLVARNELISKLQN